MPLGLGSLFCVFADGVLSCSLGEEEGCGVVWVSRPVVCGFLGPVLFEGLNPERLSDSDLPDLCLRMHVILETIERLRCEGRLLPGKLFDEMDTLASIALQGHGPP